jgi:homoserine dehydrogenase
MTHYKLALLGFGNVGRALAQLLLRKRAELQDRYDITFSVTGIATGRHGFAVNPSGIDLDGALDLFRTGRSLDLVSKVPVSDSLDMIRKSEADVLFENSPVNYETGQPAIDHVRAALELGMHVATANKGTVVHAYHELKALAAQKGRKFFFESTVMDGAPIFSLFRGALPGAQLKAFRAILNSTTNLILTRMENGDSFEGAVKYAQQIGIAETDPSGDVDGWDAAIKVAALATVLMDVPLKPQEIERVGIRAITPAMIAAAKAEGKRYKLICTAEKDGDTVRGKVAPELVPLSSPFAGVEGTTSIIEFQTDVLGNLTLIENDPSPHTTAYGLLADFINAVR